MREFPPETHTVTAAGATDGSDGSWGPALVLTQVLLQQPGEDGVSVGDEVASPLLAALLLTTEQEQLFTRLPHLRASVFIYHLGQR